MTEVHQLRDPARVLKIGADGFAKLKILATGSSRLAASKKFRDTLTGRKRLESRGQMAQLSDFIVRSRAA